MMAVLSEANLPNWYNQYLSNSIDIVFGSELIKNTEFMAGMQELFVKEAG
ncbi:MAG: hypothetical protein HC919_08740 [Oscillatoriales cyanobacterium SM2_2_1]|nr:hypothetical protein [Oscillatoriales cyanobacterium SM2_2_1]